jgi:iron complex transport system ATP-binding protein
VLSVQNVSFRYEKAAPVLEDVSLEVGRGDLLGILGPNGSGKTTLLKILCGTLAPPQGLVKLGGRTLSDWSRRDVARRVAYVPQETTPAFDVTALDIVLMGRFPHLGPFALEGPADLQIARRALESTGTRTFEGRAFKTLSGGERQRVVIASALAQTPEVLLLDEPTASLDLGHQLAIQALLERLNRETSVTMVLSTHDLNFAASLCRRLVLLREGRVLAKGPTEEVLTADAVRRLYGVDVDVHLHPRTGRLRVTPIALIES